MSTRRARIKAVTALPPRRKNVATVINKQEKTSPKAAFLARENESIITTQSDITKEAPSTPKTLLSKPPIASSTKENDVSSKTSDLPATPQHNIFVAPSIRNSPKRFASPNLLSPKRTENSYTPVWLTTPKHYEFNQHTELQVTSSSVNRVQQNTRIAGMYF